jgi:hypothetical protein
MGHMIPKYTPAAKPRNAPFEIKVADLKIFFLFLSEKYFLSYHQYLDYKKFFLFYQIT